MISDRKNFLKFTPLKKFVIKIGVEGNNTISTRYPGLGKRFCFAQPRSTFTFYVCTIAFLQGFCVLHLCFTFTFYVLVTFHGVWSWSPGHGYVTHVHVVTITFTVPGPYTLGPWSWLRYVTYVHGYGYVRGHHSTNLTRRYFDIIYVIKRYLL